MKKYLLLIIFSIGYHHTHSQNLVLNPSFDSFITCPGFGQFSSTYINNWSKPTIASSDYYNYNCPGIQPTVQAPYSGEGYAGIIAYNFGTEYREYITGTLSAPLVSGATYSIEFYASLNNGYIQAITELGAYLSAAPPGPFSNTLHISVVPQLENSIISLTDTANWMLVSGTFIAMGGEQYITIGNFNDDLNTTITQPGTSGSFGAYYFIDDVSVMHIPTTAVQSINENNEFQIWMSNGTLNIQLNKIPERENVVSVQLYNTSGQVIMTRKITDYFSSFDLKPFQKGLYFYRLSTGQSGRIMIN